MKAQKRLQVRVTKARHIVKAGGVSQISEKALSFRTLSLSKPGTWHDSFLKWVKVNGSTQLSASCAWVEPRTGSQTHCPGNQHTACWHVLASIIKCSEDKGLRVAFFADLHLAERYSRLGGKVWRVAGKDVWFVTSKNGKGN